jgi:[acyl-carrier-protein] S-malonyltransferase
VVPAHETLIDSSRDAVRRRASFSFVSEAQENEGRARERVLLFPGQSSRYAAMITRAESLAPACEGVVESASQTLGRDLRAHYEVASGTSLASNRDVQVGVFLANHLHLTALEALGGRGDRSLGLSLGEYNHLVHIGALSFEDALRVVDARGALYDAGPPGIMASIFPLAEIELRSVIDACRSFGVIEIGNYNSPTQHVLSGEGAAVRQALEILEREHYVQGVVIEDRIPMHCSSFRGVADQLRPHLERVTWKKPRSPYLPNVTGEPIASPAPADFVRLLTEHVHRPVRWRASLEQLVKGLPDAVLVEVGPRAVLYNLLRRGWLENRKLKTDDVADPMATLRATARELQDVG